MFLGIRRGIVVEVGHALRIGAPHVVAPQVQIAELLAEKAVSMKASGGGGDGLVEEAEAAVCVEARGEFEVFENRPLRKAAHCFKRRSLGELPPIPEAEPDPGPAGAPCVEAEEGRRVVELKAEDAAGGVGIGEHAPNDGQPVRGEEGIGVQEQEDVPGGFFRSAIHLRGAALRRPEDRGAPRPSESPRFVVGAPVHDDGFEWLRLSLEAAKRRSQRALLVQGRDDDRDERRRTHFTQKGGVKQMAPPRASGAYFVMRISFFSVRDTQYEIRNKERAIPNRNVLWLLGFLPAVV